MSRKKCYKVQMKKENKRLMISGRKQKISLSIKYDTSKERRDDWETENDTKGQKGVAKCIDNVLGCKQHVIGWNDG